MAIFEQIYISKYKKILKQIENLNKRNKKGYNTFAQYCFADEIMIGYFNELKNIEKKTTSIRVDSYETFEKNVFKQLEEIYNKKINQINKDILKYQNIITNSENFYKQRLAKLNDLKKDILNGYGHKCDKLLNVLVQDIDSKIEETNNKYVKVTEINQSKLFVQEEQKKVKDTLQLKHKVPEKEIQYEFPTIELLNDEDEIKEVIQSKEYADSKSKVIVGLKGDLSIRIIDLDETSHILIAGTTGIGKTILLDNIIINIVYKSNPNETKFMMFDTSNNGLRLYNCIPHLLIPIITDAQKSIGALAWIAKEIDNRMNLFSIENVEDFNEFNRKMKDKTKLPKIVIIIDEISDIVSCDKEKVDDYLTRITKQGKKTGIVLIISTNRPSSDIVAGSVKANIYTRISFFLPSRLDSKLILDMDGAEKLNNRGDILFKTLGVTIPKKYHCPYISANGVKNVAQFLKGKYDTSDTHILETIEDNTDTYNENQVNDEEDIDPFLDDAIDTVVKTGHASTSFIQRKFKISSARAGRIIDQLEDRGVISGYQGSKPREVLWTLEKLAEIKLKK